MICEVLECKKTPYPPTADVSLVLDENVSMYADPGALVITLRLTWVSFFTMTAHGRLADRHPGTFLDLAHAS